MALDSGDLGPLPSSMREMNPACFLVRWPHGIFLNDFEQGDIGPDLFRPPAAWALKVLLRRAATTLVGSAGRSFGWRRGTGSIQR